jgi:hypothetical protein
VTCLVDGLVWLLGWFHFWPCPVGFILGRPVVPSRQRVASERVLRLCHSTAVDVFTVLVFPAIALAQRASGDAWMFSFCVVGS